MCFLLLFGFIVGNMCCASHRAKSLAGTVVLGGEWRGARLDFTVSVSDGIICVPCNCPRIAIVCCSMHLHHRCGVVECRPAPASRGSSHFARARALSNQPHAKWRAICNCSRVCLQHAELQHTHTQTRLVASARAHESGTRCTYAHMCDSIIACTRARGSVTAQIGRKR